jgi:hypothetical protein
MSIISRQPSFRQAVHDVHVCMVVNSSRRRPSAVVAAVFVESRLIGPLARHLIVVNMLSHRSFNVRENRVEFRCGEDTGCTYEYIWILRARAVDEHMKRSFFYTGFSFPVHCCEAPMVTSSRWVQRQMLCRTAKPNRIANRMKKTRRRQVAHLLPRK